MRRAARRLLAWYDRARRDLPWRRRSDPWAFWVSEVMLQQTRVDTARRYFEPFLARFPDPQALAAASEEEVLAAWSGLGYYRRARALQAGARAVVARGGDLPRSAAALAELPGVGPYTAAAVAAIAFGEPVAVLDGNVARVVARALAERGDVGRAAVRRRLAAAATELLVAGRAGDSNQALMELGATVCTPRRPRCADCPLAPDCRAAAAGNPEEYPAPRRRAASARQTLVAARVAAGADGRLLLVRRGTGETVLAGMWELPTVEAGTRASAEHRLAARFGGRWRLGEELARVRHTVTFRRQEIALFAAEWRADAIAETGEARWSDPAAALAAPLTGATRKLLAALAGA